MFSFIWTDVLYKPVFNLLIWFYNTYANGNLGWAVVYLTLTLRVFLLPLTILDERNKRRNAEILGEIKRVDNEMSNDEILKKEEIRRLVKERKIRPWAKAVSLGVQLLVLILLYQVFIQGITGEHVIKTLYPFINFPGKINTMFYGFNISLRHTVFWPGIVALWLLIEIYFDYRKHRSIGGITITKVDLAYFLMFPAFIFVLLWLLPMVKCFFILTSMLFSVIVHQFVKLFFHEKKTT